MVILQNFEDVRIVSIIEKKVRADPGNRRKNGNFKSFVPIQRKKFAFF